MLLIFINTIRTKCKDLHYIRAQLLNWLFLEFMFKVYQIYGHRLCVEHVNIYIFKAETEFSQ